MASINLKSVNRCERCYHLIPTSLNQCPYCNGAVTIKKVNVNRVVSHDKVPPVFTSISTLKKRYRFKFNLTAEHKKYLKIGGIALVGLIAILFVWNLVSEALVLNKSIFEPLKDSVVSSRAEDDPAFFSFYKDVTRLRECITEPKDQERFKDVSYKDFRKFYDQYNSKEFCDKIIAKSNPIYTKNILAPMKVKVDSIVNKWDTYIETHDVNKYITVNITKSYFSRNMETHPAWYFTLEYPKGTVNGGNFELNIKEGDESLYSFNWTLQNMQEGTEKNLTFLTREYTDGMSFWEDHDMDVAILNLYLSDGTVISSKDIENIPDEVRNYKDLQSEENEYALIKALINSKFVSRKRYNSNSVVSYFKKYYPHYSEMVNIANQKAGESVLKTGF